MSQQTYTPGGTQVAEPPAPVLPEGDSAGAADNRRKLTIVGAAVGVLVLAIVAFFLLKGGSSANSGDSAFVPPHHHKVVPPAAAPAVVKLPKHVAAPVGRDPFKALYVAPAAGAAGAAAGGTTTGSTGSTQPSTGGSTGTSSGTTTTTTGGTTTTQAVYHPVWVKLTGITATTATFDVGYSNNKSLRVVHYSSVAPLHTFAGTFELLSVRSGVANVRYGDGTPFNLSLAHPSMTVG